MGSGNPSHDKGESIIMTAIFCVLPQKKKVKF